MSTWVLTLMLLSVVDLLRAIIFFPAFRTCFYPSYIINGFVGWINGVVQSVVNNRYTNG